MAAKASTVVVIDKKEYNLSGFESEEYLQRVAAYINQKITEMNQQDSYKRIPQDMKNIMLQLNLADDYFKAKDKVDALQNELNKLEKQNYDIQHEQIETKIKYESAQKLMEEQKEQIHTLQKRVLEMEAEKTVKSRLKTKESGKES